VQEKSACHQLQLSANHQNGTNGAAAIPARERVGPELAIAAVIMAEARSASSERKKAPE
jgi:hypothetical protein